jgi:ATP-grasp domain, R2K clade family 2
MPTLILTPRFTEDAQALWRAATQLGWDVERLASWRVPEELRGVPVPVLYLEGLFGPTLAEQFGLRLLEPADDWLPRLPEPYRKRWVYLTTLCQARSLAEPAFVKPPSDKSFPARVYRGSDLPVEYPDDMPVLVAEVVVWEKEFRCFILDREPRALSVYLRGGELQRGNDFAQSAEEEAEALAFVRGVLSDGRVDLPRAAVLDVGVISGRGWAVVEQNAAWGSGIYGCDPKRVLEVLRAAALPA